MNVKIGNILKEYRKYKGLTQEKLALDANIDSKYYGRIELSKSYPTIGILEKICNSLEIDIAELFLIEEIYKNIEDFIIKQQICNITINNLKNEFSTHFNNNVIYDSKHTNCIWYNGFIGSIQFDEFELKMYIEGNIRGSLYLNYELIKTLNSSDIYQEIKSFINSDMELFNLVEYMDYDEKILENKNGKVLFLTESNWFSCKITNNSTNEEIYIESLDLKTDNIIEAFNNKIIKEILLDYAFSKNKRQ